MHGSSSTPAALGAAEQQQQRAGPLANTAAHSAEQQQQQKLANTAADSAEQQQQQQQPNELPPATAGQLSTQQALEALRREQPGAASTAEWILSQWCARLTGPSTHASTVPVTALLMPEHVSAWIQRLNGLMQSGVTTCEQSAAPATPCEPLDVASAASYVSAVVSVLQLPNVQDAVSVHNMELMLEELWACTLFSTDFAMPTAAGGDDLCDTHMPEAPAHRLPMQMDAPAVEGTTSGAAQQGSGLHDDSPAAACAGPQHEASMSVLATVAAAAAATGAQRVSEPMQPAVELQEQLPQQQQQQPLQRQRSLTVDEAEVFAMQQELAGLASTLDTTTSPAPRSGATAAARHRVHSMPASAGGGVLAAAGRSQDLQQQQQQLQMSGQQAGGLWHFGGLPPSAQPPPAARRASSLPLNAMQQQPPAAHNVAAAPPQPPLLQQQQQHTPATDQPQPGGPRPAQQHSGLTLLVLQGYLECVCGHTPASALGELAPLLCLASLVPKSGAQGGGDPGAASLSELLRHLDTLLLHYYALAAEDAGSSAASGGASAAAVRASRLQAAVSQLSALLRLLQLPLVQEEAGNAQRVKELVQAVKNAQHVTQLSAIAAAATAKAAGTSVGGGALSAAIPHVSKAAASGPAPARLTSASQRPSMQSTDSYSGSLAAAVLAATGAAQAGNTDTGRDNMSAAVLRAAGAGGVADGGIQQQWGVGVDQRQTATAAAAAANGRGGKKRPAGRDRPAAATGAAAGGVATDTRAVKGPGKTAAAAAAGGLVAQDPFHLLAQPLHAMTLSDLQQLISGKLQHRVHSREVFEPFKQTGALLFARAGVADSVAAYGQLAANTVLRQWHVLYEHYMQLCGKESKALKEARGDGSQDRRVRAAEAVKATIQLGVSSMGHMRLVLGWDEVQQQLSGQEEVLLLQRGLDAASKHFESMSTPAGQGNKARGADASSTAALAAAVAAAAAAAAAHVPPAPPPAAAAEAAPTARGGVGRQQQPVAEQQQQPMASPQQQHPVAPPPPPQQQQQEQSTPGSGITIKRIKHKGITFVPQSGSRPPKPQDCQFQPADVPSSPPPDLMHGQQQPASDDVPSPPPNLQDCQALGQPTADQAVSEPDTAMCASPLEDCQEQFQLFQQQPASDDDSVREADAGSRRALASTSASLGGGVAGTMQQHAEAMGSFTLEAPAPAGGL